MARRFALVIGNAAYEHAGLLVNPKNDAAAIADVLKGLDFTVALGIDLRRDQMEDVLIKFEGDIDKADAALFFFAGHGIQVKGQNYLVPVDAEIRQEIHLRRRTFSLTEILGTMEQNARNTLIFLDACRDNPFTRSYLANVRDEERARSLVRSGLAGITLEANRSSFIAYATSPDTVAFDGTGLHSPFTQGLLEQIRTPNISISDMMIEVRKSVLKATNNRQRPWDQSALQERFCFKLADAEAKLPLTEDKPTQQKVKLSDESVLNAVALEHWHEIKGDADPRKLRAFLAEFGAANVSRLARSRLEKLEAAAWSRLPPKRTVDALRVFLADFPDGANAQTATAELTAFLAAASERTHQDGTLAEAEADFSKSPQALDTREEARRQQRAEEKKQSIKTGWWAFLASTAASLMGPKQQQPGSVVFTRPGQRVAMTAIGFVLLGWIALMGVPAWLTPTAEQPTAEPEKQQLLKEAEQRRADTADAEAKRKAAEAEQQRLVAIPSKNTAGLIAPLTATAGLFTIRTGNEATGSPDGAAAYVSSITDCEQRCARSTSCKVFVYGKSAKSCYLYTRADLSPNKDFDSGIRNSLVEPVNQASSIGSTALFTIRNGSEATGVADGGAVYVSSIGECEQKCARAATCKVFAYGKKARSCYLYMRADFSPNADFDSGVRK